MSDKLQGGVLAGSVDVSWGVVLRKSADSLEQTGKVAADMTLSYWRQGGTRTAVTASDLAAVNSAHSDGGVKEVDATNMPGTYRVDWPDAAFATGADWVQITVKVASTFIYNERIPLTTNVVQSGDSFVRLGAPAGASIAADVAGVQSDTNDIQTRLPAALVGGRMDANMGALSGSATAADNLEAGATGLVPGTCAAGSTTTSIVTNLTEATDDHYNGRVITFTGGALAGQSTSISDYNGTTKTLTVVALTEAPANTDPFVIS